MSSPIAPIEAFIPATIDYAKRKAKHLRSRFPQLTPGPAQQLTAKAMGHADWHALEEAVKQHRPPSSLNDNSSVQPAFDRVAFQMCVLCETLKSAESNIRDIDVLKFLESWQLTGPFPSDEKDPFLKLFGMSVLNRYLEIANSRRREQEDLEALTDPASRVSGEKLESAVRKQFVVSRQGRQTIPVMEHAIRALLCEQVQRPWDLSTHTVDEPDGRAWP